MFGCRICPSSIRYIESLFISVETIGEILNRKASVMNLLNNTATGLNHAFEVNHQSPEDLVFDLFKVPGTNEASIGKLLSVGQQRQLFFIACYNETCTQFCPSTYRCTCVRRRKYVNLTKLSAQLFARLRIEYHLRTSIVKM